MPIKQIEDFPSIRTGELEKLQVDEYNPIEWRNVERCL